MLVELAVELDVRVRLSEGETGGCELDGVPETEVGVDSAVVAVPDVDTVVPSEDEEDVRVEDDEDDKVAVEDAESEGEGEVPVDDAADVDRLSEAADEAIVEEEAEDCSELEAGEGVERLAAGDPVVEDDTGDVDDVGGSSIGITVNFVIGGFEVDVCVVVVDAGGGSSEVGITMEE